MERFLNQIICGDCLEVMRDIPDNSIDAVVTDPPYELGFMGKKWDSTGIAYNVELWQEVLRVLKPGGYLLSFGGTRTYHRMACAIEDAGFEIRDMIEWIYGSGFPKSLNIGKAVDKIQGNERKVVAIKEQSGAKFKTVQEQMDNGGFNDPNRTNFSVDKGTSEWEGWGTALKPAHEPICMARKPLSEKSVAENCLKWGTGGINIDGCRIETTDNLNGGTYSKNAKELNRKSQVPKNGINKEFVQPDGRFPANVIFDEEAGRMLDEQSGVSKSNTRQPTGGQILNPETGWNQNAMIDKTVRGFNDSGGASRFFYCAKASKAERAGSKHPTVKPLKLMRYLVRLITPPNGIVLDPFTGSGTTLEASLLEGFSFVGIEKQAEYIPDIKARIERGHEALKEEIEQAQAQLRITKIIRNRQTHGEEE